MANTVRLFARISGEFQQILTQDAKGRAIRPTQPANASAFYLRFTEGGKRVMKPLGRDFGSAVIALRSKEMEFEAIKRDLPVQEVAGDRLTVAQAAEKFHDKVVALDKAPATVYGYKKAVDQFQQSCTKLYMDEIRQADVLAYINWLRVNVPSRKGGQRNGMIRTRLQYVTGLFSSAGMKNPLPKKEWPKLEERRVEAYTSEEITQMLSKASDDERDLILFLLCTGFRDNEVAHAVWADVDFKAHTIQVGPKPDLGFRTKNGKIRVVPVPADLLDRLRERHERQPEGVLIFPNRYDRPDTFLLGRVRNAAKRAGMAASSIKLHKFRKAFGTRYAEKHGVVNAQKLLGHESLITTQQYLAETRIARSSVEALFEDVIGK